MFGRRVMKRLAVAAPMAARRQNGIKPRNFQQGLDLAPMRVPVARVSQWRAFASGVPEDPPLLKSARLGILRLDYDYPAAPGDIDCPDSYSYDVIYRVVPGLTFKMCQEGKMTPQVEKEIKEAIQYLVSEGVSGITGDCGFMFWFQPLARELTKIPVFLSSLAMLPAVTCAFGSHELIAVFTANGKKLTPMRSLIRDECGVDLQDKRYIIVGCEDVDGFQAVADGTKVDYKTTAPGIVKKAKEVLKDHPNVRAFHFECTELPQFSDAVRAATGLPVYDAISSADAFMCGFQDNVRFGKQSFRKDAGLLKEQYVYGGNLTNEQKSRLINKAAA